jgi:hypothetical protein
MYMPISEDRIKKHFFALYITASVPKITTKSLKRGKTDHFHSARKYYTPASFHFILSGYKSVIL